MSVYIVVYYVLRMCVLSIRDFLNVQEFASPLMTYHRFISFTLYIMGFVGFVCSLRKKYYLKQFTLVCQLV